MLKCRTEILESRLGRVTRLPGGLVGRIASEIVPDVRVLEGPAIYDEIVARDGSVYYLEDGIANDTLDCISGVYHIYTNNAENTIGHVSWWQEHDIFMRSGCFSDQWTPGPEKFYVTRRDMLRGETFAVAPASTWRANLKQMKKRNDDFITASE